MVRKSWRMEVLLPNESTDGAVFIEFPSRWNNRCFIHGFQILALHGKSQSFLRLEKYFCIIFWESSCHSPQQIHLMQRRANQVSNFAKRELSSSISKSSVEYLY